MLLYYFLFYIFNNKINTMQNTHTQIISLIDFILYSLRDPTKKYSLERVSTAIPSWYHIRKKEIIPSLAYHSYIYIGSFLLAPVVSAVIN